MSNAEITVPARAASQYDDLLKQKKKNKRKADFKRLLPLYLMMLPGLVYLLCNNYLPMFGILFAFKKMNFSVGVLQSPWCGLQNFEFLFKTKDAWIMIRNTLLYNIVWIAMGDCDCGFYCNTHGRDFGTSRGQGDSANHMFSVDDFCGYPVIHRICVSQHEQRLHQPCASGGRRYQLVCQRTVLAGDPYNRSFLAMLGPELGYLYGKHRRHR